MNATCLSNGRCSAARAGWFVALFICHRSSFSIFSLCIVVDLNVVSFFHLSACESPSDCDDNNGASLKSINFKSRSESKFVLSQFVRSMNASTTSVFIEVGLMKFHFLKKKSIIPVLLFLFDKTAGAAGSVCREAVSVRCFFFFFKKKTCRSKIIVLLCVALW